MVWRLPLWKYRYLLPMGCDQSLPSIKSRTRRNTTAILDQYKRKLYRKTIYRKSKSADKKRNWTINWRKSNPERNQIRTNIQRIRQHDRKPLERTFRNRLPHTTRKTTRKNILLDNSKWIHPTDLYRTDSRMVQRNHKKRRKPLKRFLHSIRRRKCRSNWTTTERLFNENHQYPRHLHNQKRKLLPWSFTRLTKLWSRLVHYLQHRKWRRIQRYHDWSRTSPNRNHHRSKIRRKHQNAR